MRILVFLLALVAITRPFARAAEPFFKPGDVVAFVGGEDMVVAAELGYLETLIQLALPDHKLKFRSLAREGDTVFEQRRDLNYPKLEDQLDKIGATVVICQFGQMESLMAMGDLSKDKRDLKDAKDARNADVPLVPSVPSVPENADATRKAKVAEFVAAYEKLIGRLKGKEGKRRVVVHRPVDFELYLRPIPPAGSQNRLKEHEATRKMFDAHVEALSNFSAYEGPPSVVYASPDELTRDSVHPNDLGYWREATRLGLMLENGDQTSVSFRTKRNGLPSDLLNLVRAKNRLWFHYYRPQNWAFLAGDRTNQPSSRDHLDPSKRWFPEELEKFVPLIEAKDAEIWALAKKLQ
jgi:hypothetical protein